MKIKFFVLVLMTVVLILATAKFEAQTTREFYVLTVYKVGNGTGIITSSPPGIDCGSAVNRCSAIFQRGTQVSLRPRALDTGRFHGWSVAVGSTMPCAASRGNCHFIVTENSSAQAEFVLD